MNYWQFKIKMDVWSDDGSDEYETLQVGDEFHQSIVPVYRKIDKSIGDIVYYYNSKKVKKRNFHKGIYLVCKIVSNVEDYETVRLKVIKDLREEPFDYENTFRLLHEYHNTTKERGRAQTYEFLNAEKVSLEDFDEYVMQYKLDETTSVNDINNDDNLSETEKENLIKSRLGQGKFRKDLINYWNGCSVTKYKENEVLIASHIKPWKDANNEERLDCYNGLLLLPTLDKLFDKGYITFDNKGKIIISTELDKYDILGITENMHIIVDRKHHKYLEYHRKNVFKK